MRSHQAHTHVFRVAQTLLLFLVRHIFGLHPPVTPACLYLPVLPYLPACPASRFLERYKNSAGLSNTDQQGSVTVIRVDGAGVIHDVVTPGFNNNPTAAAGSGLVNPAGSDGKADRYSCGPITIGGKGGSSGGRRAAAAAAGSNRRRQRQAGCFGMLGGDDGSGAAAAAEAGLGPEARYLREYEARLNPFAEFQVGVGLLWLSPPLLMEQLRQEQGQEGFAGVLGLLLGDSRQRPGSHRWMCRHAELCMCVDAVMRTWRVCVCALLLVGAHAPGWLRQGRSCIVTGNNRLYPTGAAALQHHVLGTDTA